MHVETLGWGGGCGSRGLHGLRQILCRSVLSCLFSFRVPMLTPHLVALNESRWVMHIYSRELTGCEISGMVASEGRNVNQWVRLLAEKKRRGRKRADFLVFSFEALLALLEGFSDFQEDFPHRKTGHGFFVTTYDFSASYIGCSELP